MKKNILAAATAVLILLLLLSGCNSFTGNQQAQAIGDPSAGDSNLSDTLTLYANTEIKTLVQWAASETASFLVNNQVFEGLYRLDSSHNAQPALAESSEVSDDGLTYRFYLRDGIKWSNGTPVTAKDFVFSWLKQMSTDATNGYNFIMTDYIVNGLEYSQNLASAEDVGLKALDEQTLEVQLKVPAPYFIRLTTLAMFFPLNEEFVTSQGSQYALSADKMIFCGPYIITSFDPAVGAVLLKNPDYWDAGSVAVEHARIRVIKEGATALNAYLAGELSEVMLNSSDVAVHQNDPEFKRIVEFNTNYLQFNLDHEVMANENIRKAVSMSINREILADTIIADGSIPAVGLIAEEMYGDGQKTFRELNGPVAVFDADKAKSYWAKGCAELGRTPELTLLVNDNSITKSVATYIQSELSNNLGADCVIDTKTNQARNDLMDSNNYMFAITAWGADYDDPMTYLDLWTNGTPYRGNYVNEAYNTLIKQAKQDSDEADRLKLLLEAEKLLVESDCVAAPLYHRGYATLTKANVINLVRHPFGVPVDLKYVSFQ